LLDLLSNYQKYGEQMFHYCRKDPSFHIIEEKAAALKNSIFDYPISDNGHTKLLDSEPHYLSFFINLHNFLVLFALCKEEYKNLPKTELDWQRFRFRVSVKIWKYKVSALEIDTAIVNQLLEYPKMESRLYQDLFHKFKPGSQSAILLNQKYRSTMNIFGFHLPVKSGPRLKIYKPETFHAELHEIAGQFLKKCVKKKNNSLCLPELFLWHSNKFEVETVQAFVNKTLPEDCIQQKRFAK
jgi:hypothetical protein